MENDFDPSGFLHFDLAQGKVATPDGTRVLVVSSDLLKALLGSAEDAWGNFGRQLGKHVVSSLQKSPSADDCDSLPPELVFHHIQGMLAIFGLGRVEFETWGRVLVIRMTSRTDGSENYPASFRIPLANVLGGLLSEISGQSIACVPLMTESTFIAVDPSASPTVETWAQNGYTLAQVITELDDRDIES